MHCVQCWKLKIIGALIIVTYCRALQQEIGEECTNKNGIVGFCHPKNKCSKDTDLGAVCNSEQTIICCAKNTFRDKEYVNIRNDQQNDQSMQSRFGFIPDFFHASKSTQSPTSSINFFNQKQKIPNYVGNVLHHSLNTLQFVADRPYQNVEQSIVTKTNKQKHTSTGSTNQYDFPSSNNNQNVNNENIFNSDQTTRKTQNYYNYNPNYEISRPNQNINNNNLNYQSTPNNIPHYNTQRPNQNQNNFNRKPGYTSTQSSHNNHYNSGNHEYSSQFPSSQTNSNNGYEEYKRPNENNNRPSSSSILFPDQVTNYNSHTKFTTSTTKSYEYQNRPNANAKRISEIKCEEYSKSMTTTISALPLSIDTASKPVSIDVCDSKSVGLIVGGSKAELGEFPHMVAIGFRTTYGNPWNCGGTLISERFVLTAAHCTHSTQGKPVRVRLGELNLKKNNDGANPIDILVDEIIVHPDYVSSSRYNDIALIRLNNIVKFNDHIRPACIYNNNNNIYSHKVTATGWGSIEYGSSSSDDLLKVNLNVINNQQCNKLYEAESKTNTLNKGIIDSMICAGYLAGGHDTCLGDSGGPLVIRSEKNSCIFNLIGITSFGKFCAAENSPGVYTKVSTYLPWIEQIVWP